MQAWDLRRQAKLFSQGWACKGDVEERRPCPCPLSFTSPVRFHTNDSPTLCCFCPSRPGTRDTFPLTFPLSLLPQATLRWPAGKIPHSTFNTHTEAIPSNPARRLNHRDTDRNLGTGCVRLRQVSWVVTVPRLCLSV